MNSNLIGLSLVLVSSVIHPLWNMILKKSDDKIIFYFNIHLFFTVLFSFVLIKYSLFSISPVGWALIFLSSGAHFFYQVFLCKTYEQADMSLTYPIIRSAPFFVAILGFFFLGEKLSGLALLGLILTVLGAQIINQKSFTWKEFLSTLKVSGNGVIIMAGLTAIFSAFYSIIDKKGVMLVHPILFFYLFFAISGILFGVYLLMCKGKRRQYWIMTKKDKYRITLAALLEFSSYILILYAFRIMSVATVVGVRQISVVIGALMGVMFLRESYGKVRIVASCVIFLGVSLLVIF